MMVAVPLIALASHPSCCLGAPCSGGHARPHALCATASSLSLSLSRQDGNAGLVRLVVEGTARRRIARLTQTYLTLSLGDIARQASTRGELERPGSSSEGWVDGPPGAGLPDARPGGHRAASSGKGCKLPAGLLLLCSTCAGRPIGPGRGGPGAAAARCQALSVLLRPLCAPGLVQVGLSGPAEAELEVLRMVEAGQVRR